MNTKPELRRETEARRKALDPRWVKTASARIVETLLSMEAFQSAKTVALYMAIGGEVNLDTLSQKCWNLGKHTCVPVFSETTEIYEMAEITAETKYSTGHFGIREPVSPVLYPKNQIDLIVVPGVAFDRKGNRLGRGGGHYDRLLEGFSGVSAGVAFDFQVLPDIPAEPHDKPVDFLVTEKSVVNV